MSRGISSSQRTILLAIKNCAVCGAEFTLKWDHQKYCSKTCKDKLRWQRKLVQDKALRRRLAEGEIFLFGYQQVVSGQRFYPQLNRTDAWRWMFYQILPVEFQRMLVEQNETCALCHIIFGEERRNRPNVDHAHECSHASNHNRQTAAYGCPECVRGVICHQCNSFVLPFLEKSPERQTASDKAYISGRPLLRSDIEGRPNGVFLMRPTKPRRVRSGVAPAQTAVRVTKG